MDETKRYSVENLIVFAETLLQRSGLDFQIATVVARTLVEGDLLGHTTHGLALLKGYLEELESGHMTKTGEPILEKERGATLFFDGKKLPGPWLVEYSIDRLTPKAKEFGIATAVIKNSHHIACLASYLLKAIKQNMLIMVASSDPSAQSVAPFGGTKAVITPNPIAMGIPASSPFLVDISSSVTTNGLCSRYISENKVFSEEWLIDADGHPTSDPKVLTKNPAGTILPLGGLTNGHKGFGLGLMVEAMTAGLAGYGRSVSPKGWGATVCINLYDLEAFGGVGGFYTEMDWLGTISRNNPPRSGIDKVRMPGDRGLALRDKQIEQGVSLHPSILSSLVFYSNKYGIDLPITI